MTGVEVPVDLEGLVSRAVQKHVKGLLRVLFDGRVERKAVLPSDRLVKRGRPGAVLDGFEAVDEAIDEAAVEAVEVAEIASSGTVSCTVSCTASILLLLRFLSICTS